MRIIEELFYGNICPSTMQIEPGSEHEQRTYRAAKIQEKFLTTLNGEEKELFLEFLHVQARICDILAEKNFKYGFKVGAMLISEALHNEHEVLMD